MKNKRGTTTLFLSIILTALILIETTYISYVADLDRRLTLTRALKSQGEVYLAQYDRVLFHTYGIYAFDSNQLDDSVFNAILRENGYEVGQTIEVSGIYQFTTEDLRRVVATFYTYRAPSILFQRFSSQIFAVIESVDEYGVLDKLREFTSSSASEVFGQIVQSGINLAQDVSDNLEQLGIGIDSPVYQFFLSLISELGQIRDSSPNIGYDFNPSDMGFLSSALENIIGMYEGSGEFVENYMLHQYLVDYAAYNFDTRLSEDRTINGLEFSSFHSDNLSDTEYILTGLEGYAANAVSYYGIFGLMFLENIAVILLDSSKREIVTSCGEVLSAIVTAISSGSVPLPSIVYEIIIVAIWAEIEAYANVFTLLAGGQVTLLAINGIKAISVGYRDCINALMFYIPDFLLLERITNIINRDFDNYYTGIQIKTNYRSRTLHYEARYDLYE